MVTKNSDEELAVVSDPVFEFMNQKADWDAAERHAEANLVLKDTTLDFNNKDSYCMCCQMPFPTEENYYPLCADNKELWETGEGFPMFFEFIKYLIYLMIFLSIVYFLPCAFLMYNAYQEIKELQPDDDIIAIFSLGAFIHHVQKEEYKYLDLAKRKNQIHVVAFLLAFAMTLSLIFLVWMRKKLKTFAAKLDLDAYTPSDFCLMGSSMDFESLKISDMKEEISKAFSEKYNIDDSVVYVNPAYRIGDIYDLLKKKDELGKCLMLVDNYKKMNKMNDTKFKEYQEDPDNCPDDFPKRKTGLFSSEVIVTEKIE